MKKLIGQDKGKEITHQLLSKRKQMQFGKKKNLNLLPIKIDLDGGKEKLNTLPSAWLFSPASNSLCHSQLLYLPTLTGA